MILARTLQISIEHPGRSLASVLSLVALCQIALLGLMACAKEETQPQTQVIPAEVPTSPKTFTPPEDGLLTEDQARGFLLAHEALLVVNDLYLDSLVQVPPARQRGVQQALDLARDIVARKFGLAGYAEYRWILEDAPRRPENVRLLERMKVTTVTP